MNYRYIKINNKYYKDLILNLYVEFPGKQRSILFLFNYNRRKKCYISFSQAIKLVKSLSLFSTKYQFTSKHVIKILLAIITCQSCNIIYIFALLWLIIERNIPLLKCSTFPFLIILHHKRKKQTEYDLKGLVVLSCLPGSKPLMPHILWLL